MTGSSERPIAIAIVGIGAIMPDAPDAATFWQNIRAGRYSISEVDPARWDPALYYDPDPKAPDKTYSKIGGWVRDWTWDPLGWHLPIPPRSARPWTTLSGGPWPAPGRPCSTAGGRIARSTANAPR
jgi:hypothetical protein